MLHRTRTTLALAGCAAAMLAGPAAAYAGDAEPLMAVGAEMPTHTVPTESSAAGEATCREPDLFNPLTAFDDRRDYFVAPAGDFEDPELPGWQLGGGASVAAGNSAHAVLGGQQDSSLSLPPGSWATSPELCVDLNYPTFRFFVAQLEGETDAKLSVDVIYPALSRNNVRRARSLRLRARDGWRLSNDVKLSPQRLGKRWGWRRIAIRFRVESGDEAASYRVDDILIDPRRYN